MTVSLHEHGLGRLRWIVVHGPDREAFRALGEHVRGELTPLTEAWPVLPRLRRHVSGPPGSDRLAAVRRATAVSFGEEWAELAAFAVTGGGLVWTIDHLPVASPGHGAGRHFVGRGLQRSARTIEAAIDYLRSRPSAGGFAYTIGDLAGRVVSVEAAAGRHALAEAGQGRGPLLWHTNHGRYVPGAEPEANGTSMARGQTLDALGIPAGDPDPSWFLRALTNPPPDGVRADPAPGHRAATLCTLVADLTAGEAVIAARDDDPVVIPLRDLAEGNPRAQRPLAG